MPIFFICFIVFLIWFRVKMKQSNSSSDKATETFWEREEKANYARRKDISHLDYITVAEDDLPFIHDMDEREAELAGEVKKRMKHQMLNLSGLTNTDLKEQYGFANLETLSGCDQNFMYFIRSLSRWGEYLFTQGDFTRSRQIMEYSRNLGSDISTVYVTLGKIYASEGNADKLEELITFVENSNFALKDSMINKLKLCRLEY